jgi:hypothetical protein
VSKEAKLYLNSVSAAGLVMFVDCAVPWKFLNVAELFSYLIIVCIAATCRLHLPGLPKNHSLALAIVLIGIASLPLPEALLVGSVAVLVEALWNPPSPPETRRILPHLGSSAIGIVIAHDFRASSWIAARNSAELTALAAITVFVLINTSLIVGAVAISEKQPFLDLWRLWFAGALPYYLAGASIVAFACRISLSIDWSATLTLLAPMFAIFWCYRQVIQPRPS